MLHVQQALNHAFYLKDHGTAFEYLNFLEDSFNKLKNTKQDIWEIAKLIADYSITNAKSFEHNKLYPACFAELNRAWKILHPITPKWKEKIEWQVLRMTVFSLLAEYHRR